jgi:hypothetical protein
MIPSDLISVRLFKNVVAKFVPDYISEDDYIVLNTLQRAFDNNSNIVDSVLILSRELNQTNIDFSVIIEDFVSSLAEHYFQNENNSDPIITQFLNTNQFGFLSKVEEMRELQIAFSRLERKRLKELLKVEDQIEEMEDMRIAFQRIERKEKKALLEEIEINQSANFSEVSHSSMIENKNLVDNTDITLQKTNWKSIVRIAAILILILIPTGISLFFFNTKTAHISHNEKDNKQKKNNFVAEIVDITDFKKIEVPPMVSNQGTTFLETGDHGFGFAQEEVKIIITCVSFNDQIVYLDQKNKSLESKNKELNTKKIKDKKSTLSSLNETAKKCALMKEALLRLESTYEFKKDKLKLVKQQKIDLKLIKVYSISTSVEQKTYYLQIGEDYFDLSNGKGKLKKVIDPEILEQLLDI